MKTYLRLVDALGLAVIGTDYDGTIRHWNAAAEALYGWREEEVLGRSVVDVTPAEISRDEAAVIMRTLAAGAVWSGEFPVRHRDGHAFRAAVTDVPFADGIVGLSARPAGPSAIGALLEHFATVAASLWPRGIVFTGDTNSATGWASDPHMLQLFSVLLCRETEALEEGQTFEISATSSDVARYDRFGFDGPSVHVRIARAAAALPDAVFREIVRGAESTYAATLVRLAGGKLYMGSPRAARSMHLLIPVA